MICCSSRAWPPFFFPPLMWVFVSFLILFFVNACKIQPPHRCFCSFTWCQTSNQLSWPFLFFLSSHHMGLGSCYVCEVQFITFTGDLCFVSPRQCLFLSWWMKPSVLGNGLQVWVQKRWLLAAVLGRWRFGVEEEVHFLFWSQRWCIMVLSCTTIINNKKRTKSFLKEQIRPDTCTTTHLLLRVNQSGSDSCSVDAAGGVLVNPNVGLPVAALWISGSVK